MEREKAQGPGGSYVTQEGGGRNLENEYHVVAMGAGTAHRPCAEVALRPAQALNDCHAEILSRRAFVKYLLNELDKVRVGELPNCSKEDRAVAEESIFCRRARQDECGAAACGINQNAMSPKKPPFLLKPVRETCARTWMHLLTPLDAPLVRRVSIFTFTSGDQMHSPARPRREISGRLFGCILCGLLLVLPVCPLLCCKAVLKFIMSKSTHGDGQAKQGKGEPCVYMVRPAYSWLCYCTNPC